MKPPKIIPKSKSDKKKVQKLANGGTAKQWGTNNKDSIDAGTTAATAGLGLGAAAVAANNQIDAQGNLNVNKSTSAGALSGASTGAGIGATIGSAVLPGLGTLIGGAGGALIGGGIGAVSGHRKAINANDLNAKLLADQEKLNNSYKNQLLLSQGLVNRSMENYKDGGKIKGKGTAKSDSIKAEIKEGSFIVPAKNAEVAEEIREKVLKAPPTKKANLKQKGGEEVRLSNGEHLFTPEETKALLAMGIDLNKLAPEAKEEIGERLKNGGTVKGYKEGNVVVKPPKNAGENQYRLKADSDYLKAVKEYDDWSNDKGLIKRADKTKDQLELEKKQLIAKINEAKKIKDDAYGLETKNIEAQSKIKDPFVQSENIDSATSVGKKAITPPSSKNTKAVVVKKETPQGTTTVTETPNTATPNPSEAIANISKANGVKTEAPTTQTNLPDGVGKGLAGITATSGYKPIETTGVQSPTVVPPPNETIVAKAQGLPITTPPDKTPPSASADWGKVLSGGLSALTQYGLPAAQAGIGLSYLNKTGKRPIDKIDPDYLAAIGTERGLVDRANQRATYGYSPEEMAMINQQNQSETNAQRYAARNLSGGSAANALNNERAAINDSFGRGLLAKTQNRNLQLSKQQYADAKQSELNGLLMDKANRSRTLFGDTLNAWNTNQQAGANLVGAGIEGLTSADRYRQGLAAADERAKKYGVR